MVKRIVTFKVTAEDVTSVTSAARILGVNRVTIYRWINSKKLIPFRFGGTYYIPKCEIERLKNSQAARLGNRRLD
jgi:excisionase family DNA binding protein